MFYMLCFERCLEKGYEDFGTFFFKMCLRKYEQTRYE